MHSGPSKRMRLSLFSATSLPLSCASLKSGPLHILTATGLLLAFGLGKDWGLPGPTPRLTLIGSRERPRTVTPWAQSQYLQRASPVLPFLQG